MSSQQQLNLHDLHGIVKLEENHQNSVMKALHDEQSYLFDGSGIRNAAINIVNELAMSQDIQDTEFNMNIFQGLEIHTDIVFAVRVLPLEDEIFMGNFVLSYDDETWNAYCFDYTKILSSDLTNPKGIEKWLTFSVKRFVKEAENKN